MNRQTHRYYYHKISENHARASESAHNDDGRGGKGLVAACVDNDGDGDDNGRADGENDDSVDDEDSIWMLNVMMIMMMVMVT